MERWETGVTSKKPRVPSGQLNKVFGLYKKDPVGEILRSTWAAEFRIDKVCQLTGCERGMLGEPGAETNSSLILSTHLTVEQTHEILPMMCLGLK